MGETHRALAFPAMDSEQDGEEEDALTVVRSGWSEDALWALSNSGNFTSTL